VPESPSPIAISLPFASQVVVVTGASGGIGRGIALELARQGADVVVHGFRRRLEAESIANEIEHHGCQAKVLLADLTDRQAMSGMLDAAWNWHGGIDVWVNVAGADVLTGEASGATFEEKLTALWRVDVQASIYLSRAVGKRMKSRGRGVILNIGWDQAEHGMAGDSGEMFAAVKGAVMAFSRSLAQSLAPEVRVNCLAPGWIKTSWGDKASDYWQEKAVRQALRSRWGTAEDVARTVAFLCSPAADFITGQVIPVNGGFRYE